MTINTFSIPDSSHSNLLDAKVFQDYNVLIVNPVNLDSLLGSSRNIKYANQEKRTLTADSGTTLDSIFYKRSSQVTGLLELGGIVVSFMQPLLWHKYEYIGKRQKHTSIVTNYDWLPENITNSINFGKGTTINYIDYSHPFSEYLNKKPSWSAYIDVPDCENWKILASAYETHALALEKRVGLGSIIFIPSDYNSDNGELFIHCIKKLLGDKESTHQPDWAKTITVPGQVEIISEISRINEKVNTLEKQRETFSDSNKQLERWKYLLWGKGKQQLEPVVRNSFSLIKCNIKPQPDRASDGAVICDYGTALLETVGSEGTIRIEKLGQLTRNMSSFFETGKGKVKGILVGNPFCNEPLENRPPKDTQKKLFSRELIESDEELSISVILSTDLYEIVCKILESKITEEEKQSLQEKIFKGKGLVRLT